MLKRVKLKQYRVSGVMKAYRRLEEPSLFNFNNLYPNVLVKANSHEEACVKALLQKRKKLPEHMVYWKNNNSIRVELFGEDSTQTKIIICKLSIESGIEKKYIS